MTIPVTVLDYRKSAKEKISSKIFDFLDGGAGTEITKHANRQAFNSIYLQPFVLRNVANSDTSVELFNHKISAPIIIAPTAFHQLLHQQGEISTAKAAKKSQVPMVVSAMSNKSLEEIARKSRHENLWLQIYIFKNRSLTKELISRAENAGYKAILVTLGIPIMGKRDRDIRNQFKLPAKFKTGNFQSTLHQNTIYEFTAKELDPSLTWDDLAWVQSITKLPVIIKGIMNTHDAEIACQLKVSGIVVSNHGGRQLDTTVATITILPDIVNIVNKRTSILLDSGIRRGTDILKAIALGAEGILLGRPVLWALAYDGEKGIMAMLNILKSEYDNALKIIGCCDSKEVRQFNTHIIKNKKG